MGTPWHSEKKKAEAVVAYMTLGSAKLAAAFVGVPLPTFQTWRYERWWKDLEMEIRDEENLLLDKKLSRIVDKTLKLIEDRVDEGDFLWDSKNQKLVRRPLRAHDAIKVAGELFDRRHLLRERRQIEEINNVNVSDHLVRLAEQFIKFAKAKQPVIDVEVIHNAVLLEGPEGLDVREQASNGQEMASRNPEGEEASVESSDQERQVNDDSRDHSGADRIRLEDHDESFRFPVGHDVPESEDRLEKGSDTSDLRRHGTGSFVLSVVGNETEEA